MAAPFPIAKDEGVGRAWKYYAAAAGVVDLTTVANKPQRCARRIVFVVAGTLTSFKDASGIDSAGPVLAGQVHDADVSSIDAGATVTFWVYW